MSNLNIMQDLIKAEQGMWFVQSDLKNAIEKAEANRLSKNKVNYYKQLHDQAINLINAIKILNLDLENQDVILSQEK